MASPKEGILQYLLGVGEATSLSIAKNLGLRGAKQVNPTLYALEKQGEVVRNVEASPPTWELSSHRKERMERNVKAKEVSSGQSATNANEGCSVFVPSPTSSIPGLEPLPRQEGSSDNGQSETTSAFTLPQAKEPSEGQWATDDIPEFLNTIRRETDAVRAHPQANNMGIVAVSLAAPPPQNFLGKLQEVKLKNPVSGLMEYAQFIGESCEFLLLDQSGPSHDPRFRMQVMLSGKLFPVAEASSKKVAKKDAAAAALRVLAAEIQGGPGSGEEGATASVGQATGLLSDSGSLEDMLRADNEEGMRTSDGARQPLSRSLPGGKNPVSVLMEYSQRSGNSIEFIVTGQAGPPHDPRFMYQVKIGETLFPEASAPSKKAARQLAAEEAVKELMADGRLQSNKPHFPLGTSNDEEAFGNRVCLCPSTADAQQPPEAGVETLSTISTTMQFLVCWSMQELVGLLRRSDLWTSLDQPMNQSSRTRLNLVGAGFLPSVLPTRSRANRAADAALRILIGEAEKAARTGELIPAELPVSGSTLHDQIAMLSHQRFNR
ncbi:hypothetical protein NQD34_012289 [Periophthalmus magnuspinnatus]|nr:hypothetical protein NQD34_012289 [Periophthalmus magnuspinnatus]